MHKPRQVAVAVPIYLPTLAGTLCEGIKYLDIPSDLRTTSKEPLFLLCSSRKHKTRYVLPKGGVEEGETSLQAALREGWVRKLSGQNF